jgi:hypothetical protein
MKELQNLLSTNDKKLLVVLPIKKITDTFLNECTYSIAQQNQPIDLLVLYNGESEEELNSLKSILDKPSISVPDKKNEDGTVEYKVIEAEKKINYVVEKTDSYTFQQIFNESLNYAVINSYETFSVIEPEDVIDIDWYQNALNYAAKKTDKDAFLPITREVSNGGFVGFFNEACWVDGYAEVAGVFDLQLLMRFNCANITGTVFKTKSIQEHAETVDNKLKVIKEDFKYSYSHEFFLRMIYNDLKFFTVPRLGYEHRIDIPTENVDPFTSKIPRNITAWPEEKGGMSPEEIKYWNETAKKEYFISRHDRPIGFEKKVLA